MPLKSAPYVYKFISSWTMIFAAAQKLTCIINRLVFVQARSNSEGYRPSVPATPVRLSAPAHTVAPGVRKSDTADTRCASAGKSDGRYAAVCAAPGGPVPTGRQSAVVLAPSVDTTAVDAGAPVATHSVTLGAPSAGGHPTAAPRRQWCRCQTHIHVGSTQIAPPSVSCSSRPLCCLEIRSTE